jgi:hypothetical protein
LKENIKLQGSNSKKDSKLLQVANSTAHHNFNMYRHSAAGGGYNYSGGSERRNSSLGAVTAGTEDGGSINGGAAGSLQKGMRIPCGSKAAKKNIQQLSQQYVPAKMTRQAVMLAQM